MIRSRIKDGIKAGLNEGRTLNIDKRDNQYLPWLLEETEKGILIKTFFEKDEYISFQKNPDYKGVW